MNIRIHLCTVMGLMIAFFSAHASGPGNPTRGKQVFVPGEFPVSDWSIQGLSVGGATLDDVRSTLGHAPQFRLGSDALSARALCYAESEKVLVIFESSPMGGATGLLTRIVVTEASNDRFETHCVRPKADNAKILEAKQELAQGRVKFEKMISLVPSFREDDRTEWKFEKVVGEWSTLSGLKARFVENRLVGWEVFFVESS